MSSSDTKNDISVVFHRVVLIGERSKFVSGPPMAVLVNEDVFHTSTSMEQLVRNLITLFDAAKLDVLDCISDTISLRPNEKKEDIRVAPWYYHRLCLVEDLAYGVRSKGGSSTVIPHHHLTNHEALSNGIFVTSGKLSSVPSRGLHVVYYGVPLSTKNTIRMILSPCGSGKLISPSIPIKVTVVDNPTGARREIISFQYAYDITLSLDDNLAKTVPCALDVMLVGPHGGGAGGADDVTPEDIAQQRLRLSKLARFYTSGGNDKASLSVVINGSTFGTEIAKRQTNMMLSPGLLPTIFLSFFNVASAAAVTSHLNPQKTCSIVGSSDEEDGEDNSSQV